MNAIAATAGPGLIGGVMVALLAGKGLALAAGKPLIAINHLEGHALSPRLVEPDLGFPYLLLLVSGGHCQLLEVCGVGDYRRLATTIDDAAGEAFDKAAKLLGLGYPGGPAIEELAKDGQPTAVPLPRPLVGSGEPHFSFAGLKSAVQRAVASGDFKPEDIAASFQKEAISFLADNTFEAASREGIKKIGIAGGVSSNEALRWEFEERAKKAGYVLYLPEKKYCTDNAAMIGCAAAFAKPITEPMRLNANASKMLF
jgi:N6-L-threonylcarbamoyladenine synthase